MALSNSLGCVEQAISSWTGSMSRRSFLEGGAGEGRSQEACSQSVRTFLNGMVLIRIDTVQMLRWSFHSFGVFLASWLIVIDLYISFILEIKEKTNYQMEIPRSRVQAGTFFNGKQSLCKYDALMESEGGCLPISGQRLIQTCAAPRFCGCKGATCEPIVLNYL